MCFVGDGCAATTPAGGPCGGILDACICNIMLLVYCTFSLIPFSKGKQLLQVGFLLQRVWKHMDVHLRVQWISAFLSPASIIWMCWEMYIPFAPHSQYEPVAPFMIPRRSHSSHVLWSSLDGPAQPAKPAQLDKSNAWRCAVSTWTHLNTMVLAQV